MNEWNEEGRGKRHGTSAVSRERSGSKEIDHLSAAGKQKKKKNTQNRHKTQ